MTVRLTTFASDRHWSPDFSGTRLTWPGRRNFETIANELHKSLGSRVSPGYADFCKILFVENDWTDALAPVVPVTPDNEHLLRTEYVARRSGELPVLRRYFRRGDVHAPQATWLGLVLYTGSHLRDTEHDLLDWTNAELWRDEDWGIVSVMGLVSPEETPMPPDTMLRNHMGTAFGGSGVPVDPIAYARSVEFWSKHAMVG